MCTPSSTVVVDMGGSEVIGRLVTSDNKPVAGADVKALKITDPGFGGDVDTQIVASVVSADSGKFEFDSLPIDNYTLQAIYKNDSLRLKPQLFSPNPDKRIDLGALVMKAPGAIKGTVLLIDGGPDVPITCYIAGTSFDAHTNRTTRDFTISGIFPVDTTYSVSIAAQAYHAVSVAGIPVRAGERTTLPDTIRLQLDTVNAPVVAPTGLSVAYDTVSGTAKLSWHPVHVSDVRRYVLYSLSGTINLTETVEDTVMYIRIFTVIQDTVERSFTFQVAALDDNLNAGPKSDICQFVAIPPSWLQIKPVLVKVESTGNLDTALVAMNFSSKIRGIDSIVWWADHPDSVIRRTNGNGQKSGSDTLRCLLTMPKKLLGVTLTDNVGNKWRDSLDAATLLPIDVWATIDSMKDARRYACACAVAGKIYVFGGCSDRKSTLPSTAGSVSTVVKPVTSVEMYDPKERIWKVLTGKMATTRFRATASVVDGKIYVFGGTTGSSEVRTVEQYSPETDIWTVVDSMPQTVFGASACAAGGVIYITGGISGTSTNPIMLKTISTYEPLTRKWGTAGELTIPRIHHQAGVWGNTIVIYGGLDSADGEPLSDVEAINFYGIHSSTPLPITLPSRFSFGAAITGTKLVVLGGLAGTLAEEKPVGSVRVCTLDGEDCYDGAEMPSAREGVATAVLDGKVFVFGGVGRTVEQQSTRSVYVYYP